MNNKLDILYYIKRSLKKLKHINEIISIEGLFGIIFTYYYVVYLSFIAYFIMFYPFYKEYSWYITIEPFQYYPILAFNILYPATMIIFFYYIYIDNKKTR